LDFFLIGFYVLVNILLPLVAGYMQHTMLPAHWLTLRHNLYTFYGFRFDLICMESVIPCRLLFPDGVSEVELDEAERNLGVKLPLDLRCVYRIHNGQNLQSFGYFALLLSFCIFANVRLFSLEYCCGAVNR